MDNNKSDASVKTSYICPGCGEIYFDNITKNKTCANCGELLRELPCESIAR